MKKFLTILFINLLLSTSSYASGLFIGADSLYGNARNTAKNSSTNSGPQDGTTKQSDKLNYGVNAGLRLNFLNLFSSAELFYDNLNLSSNRFDSSNNVSDKIKINNRYGAKLNVGMKILPKIGPFLTFGLTNVQYNNNGNTANFSENKFTPLYGIGLLIDLPFDLTLKLAYDYQMFNVRSTQDNAKIRTHLGVARVGVVYNF